jgi:hypothetical protein
MKYVIPTFFDYSFSTVVSENTSASRSEAGSIATTLGTLRASSSAWEPWFAFGNESRTNRTDQSESAPQKMRKQRDVNNKGNRQPSASYLRQQQQQQQQQQHQPTQQQAPPVSQQRWPQVYNTSATQKQKSSTSWPQALSQPSQHQQHHHQQQQQQQQQQYIDVADQFLQSFGTTLKTSTPSAPISGTNVATSTAANTFADMNALYSQQQQQQPLSASFATGDSALLQTSATSNIATGVVSTATADEQLQQLQTQQKMLEQQLWQQYGCTSNKEEQIRGGKTEQKKKEE